ncbi:MAG TPA: hypothetical protein VIP05_08175 [Burkholderiaceae bacterium]
MSNSPPPDRQPSNRAEPPGSALRAVLTGVSVDFCSSQLLAIGVFALRAAQVATPGMTPDQVSDALRAAPPSLWTMLLGSGLGALASVAGGYVCARIARRNEYRVGAVMAVVALFISLVIDSGAGTDLGLLYLLCDTACRFLGVKYGAEHNRRLEAPARSPADASAP